MAEKVVSSASRVSAVIKQGLIKVETVNYRKYAKVMDEVRNF